MLNQELLSVSTREEALYACRQHEGKGVERITERTLNQRAFNPTNAVVELYPVTTCLLSAYSSGIVLCLANSPHSNAPLRLQDLPLSDSHALRLKKLLIQLRDLFNLMNMAILNHKTCIA